MSGIVENRVSSPTYPVSISWHNIQVFIPKSKKFYDFSKKDVLTKEIVHKVSGEVKPGEFLAIMGSSGAGKTTLLNVLTARNLSGIVVHGLVRLNGRVANPKTITSVSAYVQQTDIFLPILTVREHLIFQANLKMSNKFTTEERNVRVDQLLSELGLNKCANTIIGSSTIVPFFKGISGGEGKRLAFASELLTNPSIMFCDEPTSGLDSYMAENVVNVLKKMSSEGRTIICTIHQPSSQVFELFEQLLLIADGRVAYMGPTSDAIDFFDSLGYECPRNYNPSDFYIAQLSLIAGKESESREKINSICENYLNSTYGQKMRNLGEYEEREDSFKVKKENSWDIFNLESRYKASYCMQFFTLFWRSFVTSWREPLISEIRIFQSFAIAMILGLAYWQQELDQRGVMNINGALFLLLVNLTFQNAMAVIDAFCSEIPLYLREHHNAMYRVDAYFFSKMIAEIPISITIPMIFVVTYYFMVGLNPSFENFLITILIAVLVSQCAISFGYFMSCVSTSPTMALSLGPPLIIPLVLFGGYVLNIASIPIILVWIKYISWFYYGFEALIINQWSNIEHISCTIPASVQFNPETSIHCWKNGTQVIKQFDFEENNLLRNIFMLFVLIIVLRILAFIALYLKSRN